MGVKQKRKAIAKRAKEAMHNLKKGKVKQGTVKYLEKDLELKEDFKEELEASMKSQERIPLEEVLKDLRLKT